MCVSDIRCMYHLDYNLEKRVDHFLTIKRVISVSLCVCAVVRGRMYNVPSHFLLLHKQFFQK